MQVIHPALNVMRRVFDEGFAIGNDAIVDELCSLDLVEHQFGLAGAGAEAIAHVKAAIRECMPRSQTCTSPSRIPSSTVTGCG